jgi:hypothetical protein
MKAAHSGIRYSSQVTFEPTTAEAPVTTRAAIGTAVGLAGGIAMAIPIVIWDWASSTHSVWDLPMAATSWLFGLTHYTQNGFDGWSVLIGILLLVGYAIASGEIFEWISDRYLARSTAVGTAAVGLTWGFASWLFFWYTLLPIARDGAPFYPTLTGLALPLGVSVAPMWVFILGFALLGLATSFTYRSLRHL